MIGTLRSRVPVREPEAPAPPDRQEDHVPTYAYACTACEHRFEVQQAFSDSALTECPECSGRLRKLFNAVGIVFKGSGFYRTDSRSGSTASTPAASEKKVEKKAEPAAASSSSSSSSSSTASSSSSAPATSAA